MPTYRNNRSSAIHLSTLSGLIPRMVIAGAEFEAHESEVPVTWLSEQKEVRPDGSTQAHPPIVTKLKDTPEVAAPARPGSKPVVDNSEALESAKEGLIQQQADLQAARDQIAQQQAELDKLRADAAAAATAAATTKPSTKPAPTPPADKA